MAKAKFNYNDDGFYKEIFLLASNGLSDAEISDALSDRFKQSLTPEVFSKMKNGKYEGWKEKDNIKRSEKISQALSHARRKVNATVRRKFLDIALGGKKVKSKAEVSRKIRNEDGSLTGSEDVQTTVTETELPPNLQALTTWLNNHDPEWRKAMDGEGTEDEGSIKVGEWIKENSE